MEMLRTDEEIFPRFSPVAILAYNHHSSGVGQGQASAQAADSPRGLRLYGMPRLGRYDDWSDSTTPYLWGQGNELLLGVVLLYY